MDNPTLAVALALFVGIIGQTVARHLRIPGIVLLLAFGTLLGVDGLNLIRSEALHESLHDLVGFAIAIILFEGALHLNFRDLRRQGSAIRRLISVGALVTLVGASLLAHWLMGWPWLQAMLFGTLVIVTGPTVISPLLKRIGVKPSLATILAAEGVFIDGVGAVVAVVALEAATFQYGDLPLLGAASQFALRLAFGLTVGAAAGALLTWLMNRPRIVPQELGNIFTLAAVLALFEWSNAVMGEMGIVSVIAAGVIVGNGLNEQRKDLAEFKEQLTTLLIGMLFVLLSADVRLASVFALGWPAVILLAGLMFVVRPAAVWLSTSGTDLTREDKLFLSWLSPRGIVAAAVASIFAEEMALAGQPGGDALRAMVFVVIGATVVIQGISGGWVAQWLGVKRGQGEGWVILSAGAVAQALASVLECDGQPVVLVDSNLVSCSEASEAGYQVVYGNAFEARTLARAGLPNKRGVLSLSPNYEVNALFARKALAELTQGRAAAAMNTHRRGVGSRLLERDGLPVLFGGPRDLDHWGTEFREREVTVEVWAPGPGAKGLEHCAAERWFWECLPVGVDRGTRIDPYVGEALTDESECAILLAVPEQSRPLVHRGLAEAGWLPSNLDAQSDSPGEQGAASA